MVKNGTKSDQIVGSCSVVLCLHCMHEFRSRYQGMEQMMGVPLFMTLPESAWCLETIPQKSKKCLIIAVLYKDGQCTVCTWTGQPHIHTKFRKHDMLALHGPPVFNDRSSTLREFPPANTLSQKDCAGWSVGCPTIIRWQHVSTPNKEWSRLMFPGSGNSRSAPAAQQQLPHWALAPTW